MEDNTPRRLKLNYKRTALIGFAFFGILLLWEVYDKYCASMLTDIFARNFYGVNGEELRGLQDADFLNVQWLVGIIMACDNIAALVLMPLFGRLSDKTHTPLGKRMPFILIGSFVSCLAFPFIPIFYHYNNVAGMVIMMAFVLIFMMMYRNPAVSLMPDVTPKPLRAKANGVINIMGYLGGAVPSFLGMVLVLSDYIKADAASKNLWIIEIPFLLGSVLIIAGTLVLFFTIKENRIAEEMKDDMEEGERQAAIETPIEDDKPMSKANKMMLFAILGAEFLWFMADNALSTYISNYVIFGLDCRSSGTGTLTIIGGVASVIGFITAGLIADKIGRKWTMSLGLAMTVFAYVLMIFAQPGPVDPATGYATLPVLFYIVFVVKGYGMALVHNCSLPMVVELSSVKTIGKFTGYYYTASMAAQTVTPILLGLIFMLSGVWLALPIYCTVLMAASFTLFTALVKNIRANRVKNAKGLEALGDDD